MIRQPAGELIQPIGEERLDTLCDASVELASTAMQNALVCRFLRERVLEQILQLGRAAALADQLQFLQLAQ